MPGLVVICLDRVEGMGGSNYDGCAGLAQKMNRITRG